MKLFSRLICLVFLPAVFVAPRLHGAETRAKPVTPQASPEAAALLEMLHDVSGKYFLTGQHNYPNTKNHNSEFAAKYTGKTPAIFSADWGHAKDGNSDSYLARPDIVQEAIRQHRLGALVTICWHAVPPTADEPVTFQKQANSDPKALKSVQGKLLDEQFKDVLTPGTALHSKWCAQVDAIAVFLKQLQEAHVPVLWRPYHEMNGDWFWWGGRTGEYSTLALYRQIFDRLVHHHQLKNLIWVWSVDRVSKPEMEHAKFFPGLEFVDVLALDVYGNDFAQSYYDSLLALAGGKPITLAEVGNPPSLEILNQQPRWTYYVTWAGMVRNTTRKQYEVLFHDPRILGLEDTAYAKAMANYRKTCGLPPLQFSPPPANFSGTWVLNEEKSVFGRTGASTAPARLEIVHRDNSLTIKTARILEYTEDQVTEEKLALDGTESKSEFMNSPRVTTARRSEDGAGLTLNSTSAFTWGPPKNTMTTEEKWRLLDGGKTLSIQSTVHSLRGEIHTTLVFDRR